MGKKRENLLVCIYVLMIILCICLNVTSDNGLELTNILVNVGLFVIVGAIFFHAMTCFKRVNSIAHSLNTASEKIKEDFNKKQVFLWNTYKNEKIFFNDELLNKRFKEYQFEMNRLATQSENGYQCNIENYINRGIIDEVIERNIMNLVAGAMTGLGILGTFIGLSFGLQEFKTDNAEKITNSITPLMNGIKMAFHTSIYGMVFSLCFNYIYKRILDDANKAVDLFLDNFQGYVTPDVQNDSINKLLMYQKEQADNMKGMVDTIGERLAVRIGEVMSPQFDRMNDTIEKFASVASQSQVEGVGILVDKFVSEMNQSLGNSFKELGNVIEQTCEWQKKNSVYMEEVLDKIASVSTNIQEINDLSNKTIEKMSGYVEKIENLQSVLNENFISINEQMKENNQAAQKQQEYIETLVGYEKNITTFSEQFTNKMIEQTQILRMMENDISDSVRENIEAIVKKSEECNEMIAVATKQNVKDIQSLANSTTKSMDNATNQLSQVCQQLNKELINSLNITFDAFDKNLSEITKHLSGTIAEVDSTTERVPNVVLAAYEGMEKTLVKMQDLLETLVHSMDIMRRSTASAITLFEED